MHKIAMISGAESRLPVECVNEIRNSGAELICRRCGTPEELVAFAPDCDIIWMFGANTAITPAALDQLPQCRALMRSGSGLDALPLDYAKAHGIKVFNTPESISESVAEHAVSLLLSLARQVVQFDRQVHDGAWDSSNNQTRWHLTGRTLGLVGYGLIARSVERMLAGFNMKVLHFDPYLTDSTPLEELLPVSDFVSLHCPLAPETKHLMNRERFALMKKDALLINTSRGGVVDEAALLEALETGTLGGAALDVLADEPPGKENPLLSNPKVIITPHVAAFSADFEKNFWAYSAAKLKEICRQLDMTCQCGGK